MLLASFVVRKALDDKEGRKARLYCKEGAELSGNYSFVDTLREGAL